MRNYLSLFLLISLIGCSTSKKLTDYYEENTEVDLFAFVGKKISVVSFNPYTELNEKKVYDSATGETIVRRPFVMDNVYKCKYEIIKNVYNNPKIDTIEFFALDHYGIPAFSGNEMALLYITKNEDGDYFQLKYQYDKVEKNAKGQYSGFTFDRVMENDKPVLKNKKMVGLKELFLNKKTGGLKPFFDFKNEN